MSDSPITLETLVTLLREVQADQRNIRTEQETIRGLITQEASSIQSALSVFQTALLGRLGDSEALIETRLDAIEAKLGGTP
jgi:sensor domain CHASE-containing protein